jgi:hypothetical protein
MGIKGFKKPGEVVKALTSRVPFKINADTHTRAWKYYDVRPRSGSATPEKTKSRYCAYDDLGDMYGYTDAWVVLGEALSNPEKYKEIMEGIRFPFKRQVDGRGPLNFCFAERDTFLLRKRISRIYLKGKR